MATYRAKVGEGGRVVIPAELRRQLGLQPGTEILLDSANGELRIRSVQQAVRQAQAIVQRYVSNDVGLADELIRERRAAAQLE